MFLDPSLCILVRALTVHRVVVQQIGRRFIERDLADVGVDGNTLDDVTLSVSKNPSRLDDVVGAGTFTDYASVLQVLDPQFLCAHAGIHVAHRLPPFVCGLVRGFGGANSARETAPAGRWWELKPILSTAEAERQPAINQSARRFDASA